MILDKIIAEKKREIERNKKKTPLKELIAKTASYCYEHRDFKEAVSAPGKINLIAEIKKASPSKGILREDFDPLKIAKSYAASGASSLSILTEKEFFQGDLAYLKVVKDAVNLPILRKDFIVDEYQIYESVCAGADSILLIVKLLSEKQLADFYSLCIQLKLDAVCEVHNEEDLDKVLPCDVEIVGINNRSLESFSEDLQVSANLIKKIPQGKVVISESGIKSSADVKYLQSLGVNAVLIGEAFMCSQDIGAKVRELMYGKD